MMTLEQVQAFLYREARYLDDREWDEVAGLLRPTTSSSGCRPGTTTTS